MFSKFKKKTYELAYTVFTQRSEVTHKETTRVSLTYKTKRVLIHKFWGVLFKRISLTREKHKGCEAEAFVQSVEKGHTVRYKGTGGGGGGVSKKHIRKYYYPAR